MSLPLTQRLRETARRICGEESIHLGNLRRLLVEAADEIDRRKPPRDPAPGEPGPRRLTVRK